MLEALSKKVDKVNMVETALVKQAVGVIAKNIDDVTKASFENISSFINAKIMPLSRRSPVYELLHKNARYLLYNFKNDQLYERNNAGMLVRETYAQQIVCKAGMFFMNLEAEGKAIVRDQDTIREYKEHTLKSFESVLEENFYRAREDSPIDSIKMLIKEQAESNKKLQEIDAQLDQLELIWYDKYFLNFKREIRELLQKLSKNNLVICSEMSNLINNENNPRR